MTACPPTRIWSSLDVRAHDVAVSMKCFKYLKINSVNLALLSPLVFSLESFHAAGCVDQFLFTGEEGVTFRTDFEMDLGLRRAGPESFSTSTSDDSIDVVRMDIWFH